MKRRRTSAIAATGRHASGIAWGVDGRNGKAAKTVVRLGFGTYDRIGEITILAAEECDKDTQQSYVMLNPDTEYPR